MKFKVYYYEEEKKCIITKKQVTKPIFENIKSDRNSIIINIEQKNSENIYDFFRNNTLIIVLSTDNNSIEIDYSEIENEDFFSEESFVKLKELIDNLVIKTNKTINDCKAVSEVGLSVNNLEEIQENINDVVESIE